MFAIRGRKSRLRKRRRETSLDSALALFDLSGGATYRVVRSDAFDTVGLHFISTRDGSSDLARIGGDFHAACQCVGSDRLRQEAELGR